MLRFKNQHSLRTRNCNESYRVGEDGTWKERRDISAHLCRSASDPSAKFAAGSLLRVCQSGLYHHDRNVGTIWVQPSARTPYTAGDVFRRETPLQRDWLDSLLTKAWFVVVSQTDVPLVSTWTVQFVRYWTR